MTTIGRRTVLILTEFWYPQYGGSITHVEEISKKFVTKFGAKVVILARRTVSSAKVEANFSGYEGRIEVIKAGVRSRYENPLGVISWFLETLLLVLRLRCDIIYSQAYLTAFPALLGKRLRGIPVVYRMAGIRLWVRAQMGEPAIVARCKNWLETYLASRRRGYDHMISSDARIHRVPNVFQRISVIPNGVDVDLFDSVEVEDPEVFTLVFVGRIHREKNLPLLVKALAELEGYPYTAKIVGTGDEEGALRNLVAELGLTRQVAFRGAVNYGVELVREFKQAHVFVLPSITEGQPLTLLQAWAARLPVIVTDVGDNARFVQDGVNGFMVPSGDVVAMAGALDKAMRMPEDELLAMGMRGYHMVKDEYSWDVAAARVWRVFEECWLRQRRGPVDQSSK